MGLNETGIAASAQKNIHCIFLFKLCGYFQSLFEKSIIHLNGYFTFEIRRQGHILEQLSHGLVAHNGYLNLHRNHPCLPTNPKLRPDRCHSGSGSIHLRPMNNLKPP